MASIHGFQEIAVQIKPGQVKNNLFDYIQTLEALFFDANISQLQGGENAKGGSLKNSDGKYSGFYTETTELIAKRENPLAPKVAGELYNFIYEGDFKKGFELFIKSEDLELFSTGLGDSRKQAFFDGYKHLFGLKDENLKAIIDKELLPFIQHYYRERLGV